MKSSTKSPKNCRSTSQIQRTKKNPQYDQSSKRYSMSTISVAKETSVVDHQFAYYPSQCSDNRYNSSYPQTSSELWSSSDPLSSGDLFGVVCPNRLSCAKRNGSNRTSQLSSECDFSSTSISSLQALLNVVTNSSISPSRLVIKVFNGSIAYLYGSHRNSSSPSIFANSREHDNSSESSDVIFTSTTSSYGFSSNHSGSSSRPISNFFSCNSLESLDESTVRSNSSSSSSFNPYEMKTLRNESRYTDRGKC